MKSFKFLLLTILMFSMNTSCSSQSSNGEIDTNTIEQEKVKVYYFHTSRRCATCNAIESVSKKAIAEVYGDKVSFNPYNLDDAEGKEESKKVEVSGQSLIIVSGEIKINITNEGFMHARSNPEKLKEIIKSKIEPLL